MDRMGARNIQCMGFCMLFLLYGILALRWSSLGASELIIVYGLTFFFSNFGPNATTFILPSETVRKLPNAQTMRFHSSVSV
jgi:MFS transporter, PHS family, inorganic phosphate transporter